MSSTTLSKLVGSKDREQTVFTPQNVLDVPQRLWGRIQYDACHGHPGFVTNKRKGKPDHVVAVESLVNAVAATDCLGLIMPWPKHSWINPPFNVLAAWLAMSMLQNEEHMMLVPVRPHRKWWREWSRVAEVAALNPIRFVGHDGTFPPPLVLAHRNSPTPGAMTALCVELGLGEAW